MDQLLIVNPFASGVSESKLAGVVAALPLGTGVLLTSARGDAAEMARNASSRGRTIYVFSGDGTYNEVLNGLEQDVPVGFIPGGGTSVLPRALGLPRDPVRAAKQVSLGVTRRISLGRVNGRRFGFNAGIGLDAELVRRVDQLGRAKDGKRPGDIAFGWTMLRTIAERRGRFEPGLELEGLGRAAFALIANGSPYTYAGSVAIRLAPDVTFEGGFDVVAPAELRGRTLTRFAVRVLRGRGIDSDAGVIYAHDLDRIVIRCDSPMPLQMDGEDLGDVEEAVIEAERDVLTVLV
jgi:diacylglycerol kinase family enzyme